MATIQSYPVQTILWRVHCDCPTDVGKAPATSEREAQQWLEHHERQVEHQEWIANG